MERRETKKIEVDFLYLDLSVCERCMGTDDNLEEAINLLRPLVKELGFEIVLNKINITSKELAIRHKFLSSPTIRINGRDICLNVKENACGCCSDLSGNDVDCRVFVYDEKEYTTPPKSMIIDAVLSKLYLPEKSAGKAEAYVFPGNLEVFFSGMKK